MPYHNLAVYISNENDPYFNLALEDYLFQNLDAAERALYLWRNMPSVVIGRSQNPWVECRLTQMKQAGVRLVRRPSGGGAVYQDLGNSNFTFMSANEHYNQATNLAIVQKALNSFGIHAYPKGRNDLVVDYKNARYKVSGSAFRQTQSASFHHGTLLIDVDFDALGAYLQPNQKKLESKGVKSVRSRVMNLNTFSDELNHDALIDSLKKAFEKHYQSDSRVEQWDKSALERHPDLKAVYQKLASWDWRFGRTLAFNHRLETRFSWGTLDMRCYVERGLIHTTQIFSDTLHPELIAWLENSLFGIHYAPGSVRYTLSKAHDTFPSLTNEINDLEVWLPDEIEGEALETKSQD